MSKSIQIDWNDLYNQEAGRLLGICRRYVRDTQLAEDLLHDGFIKAMENIHSYSGQGPIEAWLKRVVLNNLLEHLRQTKKVNFSDIEELNISEENQAEKETDALTAKSIIENYDFSQTDLIETIDCLAEHHKTVFCLYVIDGYSHKEISDLLNIEIGTSKSHLSRARKKIQQHLLEKASDMKQGDKHKKRRRALGVLPLIGVGAKANSLDRLFQEAFADYQLPKPTPSSSFKKLLENAAPIPVLNKSGFFHNPKNIYWSAGISGAVIIGAIAFNNSNNYNEVNIEPVIKVGTEKPATTAKPIDTTSTAVLSTNDVSASTQTTPASNKPNTASTQHTNTSNNNNTSQSNTTAPATETIAPDTAKKAPVVIRKQVVIRKTVEVEEESK